MKIERKYMAHYLNATFAADDGTASYVRLGKDLEEYSPELSANVEKKTNILGNETVSIDSYQKQGEVSQMCIRDRFYAQSTRHELRSASPGRDYNTHGTR